MILPHTYAAGRLAEERRMDARRDGEHAILLRSAKPVRVIRKRRFFAGLGAGLFARERREERTKGPSRLVLEARR